MGALATSLWKKRPALEEGPGDGDGARAGAGTRVPAARCWDFVRPERSLGTIVHVAGTSLPRLRALWCVCGSLPQFDRRLCGVQEKYRVPSKYCALDEKQTIAFKDLNLLTASSKALEVSVLAAASVRAVSGEPKCGGGG